MALLDVRNLTVEFPTSRGPFRAVEGVDLTLDEGDLLGVVGESGSGKSVTMLAVMGLVAKPGIVTADKIEFAGQNLIGMSARDRRRLIGRDIAMIFQEPMTSLNPCFTVGFQIMETLKVHVGGTAKERRHRAIELLERVGIPAPESRLRAFPHQLSGGMSQRVMIAMAISCSPRLLFADEPSTALDVTIQAQILDLLIALQHDQRMALVLVTHDMGVIAESAEQVVVMYAGQVVEQRDVNALFSTPVQPYTAALLDSLPERHAGGRRLPTLPGVVPGAYDRPDGCLFNPRCRFAEERCRAEPPALRPDPFGEAAGKVRCHRPLGPDGVPA